jgi:conjugative transfer ATPase
MMRVFNGQTLKRWWSSQQSMPGVDDIARQYQPLPSITPWLALREYDPVHKVFLLADQRSVGTAIDIQLLPCESRPAHTLQALAGTLASGLQQAIPQEKGSPWVVQWYVEDDLDLAPFYDRLQAHVPDARRDEPLTQRYLNVMRSHMQWMAREGGVFLDRFQGGQRFNARIRRVRILLYRNLPATPTAEHSRESPLLQLRHVRRAWCTQLRDLGLAPRIVTGNQLYDWLVAWFNPAPKVTDGDPRALRDRLVYPPGDRLPVGWDFGERCFFATPRSDGQYLWLDDLPHSALTVQGIHHEAGLQVGHFTGECVHGDHVFALMDRLHAHSKLCLTMVIQHQDEVRQWLKKVEHSALGQSANALRHKAAIAEAQAQIDEQQPWFPMTLTCFLRGKDVAQLEAAQHDATALLVQHGFQVVQGAHRLTPVDTYLRHLPMNYDFRFDQKYLSQSRLVRLSTLAKLLPVYGRSRGTDHPGLLLFNRGGEPFCFDILRDKLKNGHTLVLGETGTGKSNLCVYLLTSLLAHDKPRVFILEAGGSFHLFAQFLMECGLSVNTLRIRADRPISLNPFADGLRVLTQLDALDEAARAQVQQDTLEHLEADLAQQTSEPQQEVAMDEQRDLLGEMVIAALLMITGCDPREEARLTRRDRAILVDAILLAANTVRAQPGRHQLIASDIVAALNQLADGYDPLRDSERLQSAKRMSDNMAYFCRDPLSQQFFDREGAPWPLVDVTVIDFGLFAHEGYEAHRALAYAGINHRITAIAEATQHSARPVIAAHDELHIFLRIPLLAAMLTREAKMARKLGLVLLLFTQNMRDFSDESQKVLAMMENFMCLALPPDEIAQVERFRTLTAEERALFESAKKVPGQYTEGVLLSPKVKGLFRVIPPKLFLNLAATDKHEKSERQRLMKQHGISELAAAMRMAEQMMQMPVEAPDEF